MIGIIWEEKHNSLDAKTQFQQIIKDYNQLGIYPTAQRKNYVRFVNHDEWYLLFPDETTKGKICNIAYIHRDITTIKINTIIMPAVRSKPFQGIIYYGDTH